MSVVRTSDEWLSSSRWMAPAHPVIGGVQRPPNYQSSFARWPSMASQSPCTFPGSMEVVATGHLGFGMETPRDHAKIKISEAADFDIGLQGTRRFGGRCSSHVTASLTDLHCSSSAGRLSGRGRPTRPHGPARRSGTHPHLHPLELSPSSPRWPESLELRGGHACLQLREGRGIWVPAARG